MLPHSLFHHLLSLVYISRVRMRRRLCSAERRRGRRTVKKKKKQKRERRRRNSQANSPPIFTFLWFSIKIRHEMWLDHFLWLWNVKFMDYISLYIYMYVCKPLLLFSPLDRCGLIGACAGFRFYGLCNRVSYCIYICCVQCVQSQNRGLWPRVSRSLFPSLLLLQCSWVYKYIYIYICAVGSIGFVGEGIYCVCGCVIIQVFWGLRWCSRECKEPCKCVSV